MKSRLLLISLVLLAMRSLAQVQVRNVVPVDVDKIEYPNLTGNTTSSQAYPGTVTLKDGSKITGKITLYKKKGVFERVKVKTADDKVDVTAAQIGSIALDPKIYERKYPNDYKKPEKNFQTGYVILPDGQKLVGKVAQLRDLSDYDFFTYNILFLPEGSTVASTLPGGKLVGFGQEINGTVRVWDGYADGYLLRLVDGHFRLARNPYSKTKNEFFTSLKTRASDSLAKEAAAKTLAHSIQSGSNINESIENATNAAASVGELLGQIEINKKEFLIYDTRTNSLTTINKDSFPAYSRTLVDGCPVPPEVVSWDKMEEFVKALNAACP